MTIDPKPIAIELTPRFQRDLRTLGKRYRNIRKDIQPVIETVAPFLNEYVPNSSNNTTTGTLPSIETAANISLTKTTWFSLKNSEISR